MYNTEADEGLAPSIPTKPALTLGVRGPQSTQRADPGTEMGLFGSERADPRSAIVALDRATLAQPRARAERLS